MIEVIDGVIELLEPRSSRTIEVDETGAEPMSYAPGLYVFERSDDRRMAGNAPADLNDFVLSAVLVVDDAGERAAGHRLREVSEALDAKREEYLKKVRANRVGPPIEGHPDRVLWANLIGSADMDFIRALDVRGIAITLRGWRFVEVSENG